MLASYDPTTKTITLTFRADARLQPSASGKSFIVAKVLRPERVAGTEVSFTFTAWVPKSVAIAEGLTMDVSADAPAA
ncbi:MAG: hypothetical protein ACRDGM_01480 [bacterium]